MLKTCVIGASGYTGIELIKLILNHPKMELNACYVSPNSVDDGKLLSDLHPSLMGLCHNKVEAIKETELAKIADEHDLVFLATPHEASHDWVPLLANHKAKILDLSGAFRLQDTNIFSQYYGFKHTANDVLTQTVYGLAEWYEEEIMSATVVAVPGCYPTASLLAIKPIVEQGLLAIDTLPIINAVSGVSGAGRKASLVSSFNEVSLQAYGVLGHRHSPEIAAYADNAVIFTPHLGNFKRGILATVTMKLNKTVSVEEVNTAFETAYANKPLTRIMKSWPKVDDTAGTPFCDLFWKYDTQSNYLVVSACIDNLLKGAASQAIQCANIIFGLAQQCGLVDKYQAEQ